jgi:hypothetical protein
MGEAMLLAVMLVTAAPLLASLATEPEARQPVGVFASWLERPYFRLMSGYAALAVIVLQLLIAVRLRARLPGGLPAWKAVHKRSALLLLMLVVLHTGGRWGLNLNGWLVASLVAMILVAQAGHIAKAAIAERRDAVSACLGASSLEDAERAERLHELANGDRGSLHRAGLLLHVTLAAIVSTLVGFHVFGFYFFR